MGSELKTIYLVYKAGYNRAFILKGLIHPLTFDFCPSLKFFFLDCLEKIIQFVMLLMYLHVIVNFCEVI